VLHYHIAQINTGRMLHPANSPEMFGFTSRLDEINALADVAPGFVWRLQSSQGNAMDVQAFDDPAILINLSVWDSIEALKAFSYRTAHSELLRDRRAWFEPPAELHLAMWWVPAGHIPTVQESVARLEYIRKNGPTAIAFTFAKQFPTFEVPKSEGVSLDTGMNNLRLAALARDPNGDAGSDTIFRYRQQGPRVWATYDGGRVRFGSLTGVVTTEGHLDIRYHHLDPAGEVRTGWCRAIPRRLPDGRMQLNEEWQWTNGGRQQGRSILEELAYEPRP
jgi:hypothetical protein